MPPLPPLPPLATWKSLFPRHLLRQSMDESNRQFMGRSFIADPAMANRFVRALKLRNDEVVIEAFPGMGLLTRALIDGGNDRNARKEHPRPKVVVACEPSSELLVHGLGMREDQMPERIPVKFESEDYSVYQSFVHQSEYEPTLRLSPSTPYRWPTLVQMLSHPLVAPYIPEAESNTGSHERSWRDPPPHITLVSQMPVSVAGDQMIAQWIGSAAGDSMGVKSWIWQWGRLRMAVLLGKNQYDRIMAGPGETIHCKLSVITQALFNVSPLPPYHHVFNVDKSSSRTEDNPIKRKGEPTIIGPAHEHPPDLTYPDDFYPIPRGLGKHTDIPLPRPILLGVLFEPRLDSPITIENKDEWDYVLRRCFVTEAQSIGTGLKNLAFGGEGLIGKIESEGTKFAGRPVPRTKIVRDLDVEDWTRVVDVFTKWAFKPDNLILDARPGEDNRQIGQD